MAEHAYTPDREGYERSLADLDDARAAEKPQFSKVIVVLLWLTIMAFTVTCLVFYWHGKTVDPVLIGFFFGCFGFEFGSLAFIKSKKLRYVGGNAANKQVPHVEIAEEEENEDSRKADQP